MITISNHALKRIKQRLYLESFDEIEGWIRKHIQVAYKNEKFIYVITAHGKVPGNIKWNPNISKKVIE